VHSSAASILAPTNSASTSVAGAVSSHVGPPTNSGRIADRTSVDGEALVRTSRPTARIDNNAIADGFQIYLHSFVVTRKEGRVGRGAAGDGRRAAFGSPLSLALRCRPRLH
jgi:hypothetical protein